MTLKVTIIGNVTRDAVLRRTQGGDSVLNFALARNDRRTKEATFVDCSIWGKLGETLAPYVKKGQKVYCEGELSTREYEGKTYLQCRVRDIELVGSRQDYSEDRGQTVGASSDLDDSIPF